MSDSIVNDRYTATWDGKVVSYAANQKSEDQLKNVAKQFFAKIPAGLLSI